MLPSMSSITDTVRDLRDLLVSYAKQETIDPLRNLGRYLGYGLSGMSLITLGVFLLGMAVLRAMQSMTGDVFNGFWSWVPYLVVVLGFAAVLAFVISRISRELDHSRGEDL
jgi:Putative Actinobacterial Holin-X, holin superfamily III